MSGPRFVQMCIASAVIIAIVASVGCAQDPLRGTRAKPTPQSADTTSSTCKIYSLADYGGDAELCKWIADTIPAVIQPGSWTTQTAAAPDEKRTLQYYAPGKIMVVYHSPAAHAEVAEFLTTLKKSLPAEKVKGNARTAHDPLVMPAQLVVPDATRPVQAPFQSGYPVPLAVQTPKHLFHFIIRYEGEGIIDSNVVKFAKALNKGTSSSPATAYAVPVPPPGPVVPSGYPVTEAPMVLPNIPTPPPSNGAPLRMPLADVPGPAPAPAPVPAPLPPPSY